MLYDVVCDAEQAMAQFLQENATKVSAGVCGLDERAGSLWVCDDAVVTENKGRLDYYGGFEYVDKEYIKCVGKYTVYFADCDRVQDCIDAWQQHTQEA